MSASFRLLIVLGFTLTATRAYAGPVAVPLSVFSPSATLIEFDTIAAGDQITTQYSGLGVTFSNVFANHWASIYYPSPMQGSNFYAACGSSSSVGVSRPFCRAVGRM
jgi:hypothetical protein